MCRLKRLRDSRRALEQFDKASSSRLDAAITELQMHCQLLRMVKQDMDHIYHSIRCSHPHYTMDTEACEDWTTSNSWSLCRAMRKKLVVIQTDEGLSAAESTTRT